MRRIALPLLLALTVSTAQADNPAPDVKGAIDKGLAYLAKEAVTWKNDRKCASCHHAPFAIWSLNEAAKLGYAVDQKSLEEVAAWVVAKDNPAKVFPPPPMPKDESAEKEKKENPPEMEITLNQAILMLALGFEAGEIKDDLSREGLNKMLNTLLDQQRPDGSWGVTYVWEPIGSTPDVLTGLALLSLTSPSAPDLGERAKTAREKGLAFLESASGEASLQRLNLKLLLGRRLGKPADEQQAIVNQIVAMQNADGGFSQNKELASDAYATGQTLYALAEGGVPANHPAVAKAREFLIKGQDAGGSWVMSSRPGGPGGKSAKNVAPITYVGTAWAVMGLMRTSSQAPGAGN
jgi:hypothetical protein